MPLCLRAFLVTIVLALIARAYGADFVDDTYIFLRYAQNIADGLGPVFNPGEFVEGFSSPLWTFLLAAAATIINVPLAAYAMGLVCGAGCVLLVDQQLRRLSAAPLIRAIAAATLLTLPDLVFWSGSGMDTAVFTLLATASILSAARDHDAKRPSKKTIALLVLCALARAEGVIVVALIFALRLIRHRNIDGLPTIGVALLAMLAARYAYYQSLVPNTFHAKVNGDTMARLSRGLAYLGDGMIAHWPMVAVFGVVVIFRITVGTAKLSRHRRDCPLAVDPQWPGGMAHASDSACRDARVAMTYPSQPARQWPAAFWLYTTTWIALWCSYVIYVGGDNFGMHRFLLPIMPLCILLIFAVIPTRAAPSSLRRFVAPSLRTFLLPSAFCLLPILVLTAASHLITYRHSAKNHLDDIALVSPWKNTGQWLRTHTPPDAVIATCVPGAIGFYSQRTTIDMLGLTDRSVAEDGKVFAHAAHAHGRYNTDYIFARQPDYVIYHSSGRYIVPKHPTPESINRRWGNALYDFVTDPRCAAQYEYATASLPDGTLIEMQRRRLSTR